MNKLEPGSSFLETYNENALVKQNTFINQTPEQQPLPTFEKAKEVLPQPFWDNHESSIACYWKAWELAFRNLRPPTPENGFIQNYIDTAFNDNLFLWDSVFILMFGRYGIRAFNFQQTLDNLYCKQHPDGFICREIRESDGGDMFHRHDPTSTGPNILAWSEWEYYLNVGDLERLRRVFPVLMAYHQWMRTYRTFPGGGYWSSGWGCGMDNQPRLPAGYAAHSDHGKMIWVDACFQAVISARLLLRIAQILEITTFNTELHAELQTLIPLINNRLWDSDSAFYYDQYESQTLNQVKSIGAYWGLLATSIPDERLISFLNHLNNPEVFNRPHRIPTLGKDHPAYQNDGGYWLGGVWPPTNYMVLRGLSAMDASTLAFDIAQNHLNNVVEVFDRRGTVYENYAPESANPGTPAKADFVGWGGLGPIAILFEYLFGLRPEAGENRLLWDIRLLESHGVSQYPFGSTGLVDLHCEKRSSSTEQPIIHIQSTVPLTLLLRWDGGTREVPVTIKI
jgi:glycogen debranching enzyme